MFYNKWEQSNLNAALLDSEARVLNHYVLQRLFHCLLPSTWGSFIKWLLLPHSLFFGNDLPTLKLWPEKEQKYLILFLLSAAESD